MPQCSLKGCKSTFGVKVAKTQQQFENWKSILNNKKVTKKNNLRICELHFKQSDFELDYRSELLNEPVPKKLKSNPVPCIGLPIVHLETQCVDKPSSR